jgi:hypothetical protein
MDRKLRSKAGQAIYALRKTIVEPVFGQIKGARWLECFLIRGLVSDDNLVEGNLIDARRQPGHDPAPDSVPSHQ